MQAKQVPGTQRARCANGREKHSEFSPMHQPQTLKFPRRSIKSRRGALAKVHTDATSKKKITPSFLDRPRLSSGPGNQDMGFNCSPPQRPLPTLVP